MYQYPALTSEDERTGDHPDSSTRSYFEIKGIYYGFKQGRNLDVQQLGINVVFNRGTAVKVGARDSPFHQRGDQSQEQLDTGRSNPEATYVPSSFA